MFNKKILIFAFVGFFVLVLTNFVSGAECAGSFSCEAFGTSNICQQNSGCQWTGIGMGNYKCLGTTSCSQIESESSCEARSGCTWDVYSFDSRGNLLDDYLEVDWETGGQPSCINEATQQCGTDVGECSFGTKTCANGVWGACIGGVTLTAEICNDGKDNDCDGTIDEEECSETPLDCSQYNLCSQIQNPTDCNSCQASSLDGCLWNTTSCNPYENQKDDNENDIKCVYEENTDDTCEDDGRLDYLLELTSDSHEDCDTKDPVSIFCSAQTSLPLENKFGILLTIISIIGIYFIFFRRKKILKKC